MAYVTASGQIPFENAGNLLLLNTRPNGSRPLSSGNDTAIAWLREQPEFSDFLSLVYMANLQDDLDDLMTNKTIFVPTNEALAKRPELLSNLNRSMARAIVKYHCTKDLPIGFNSMRNNLFETRNASDVHMTIDGRTWPFRVGYNTVGGAFGIAFNVCARMATKEFITKNSIMIPIDECIFPTCEILG